MKLAFACDHGGLVLKKMLMEYSRELGHEPVDLGTKSQASVDYGDYAVRLAESLRESEIDFGVLICGSGIGMSIAANRFSHIRAALVHDATGARLCREHNDANVLVLGGRTTGAEVARDCLATFLMSEFQGGRHQARVRKLTSTREQFYE